MVPSERAGECKKQTREQYNWFKVIFVIFLAMSQRHKQIAFWQAAPWRELWLKCDYNAYLNQRFMLTNHSHTHTHHRSAVAVWSSSWRNALLLGRTMGLKGEKDRDVEEGDTFPKSQLTSWDDWLRIITAPFAPNGQDGLTELYFTARCWSPLLHTHTHKQPLLSIKYIHT